MAETAAPGRTIHVQVLSTRGCVNAAPTVARIRETADDLDVSIVLEEVVVTGPGEALARKLCGSPTVLIDGLDLEPAMRGGVGPVHS